MRCIRALLSLTTLSLLALSCGVLQVEAQPAGDIVRGEGRLILTGGALNFGDAAERRQVQPQAPKPLVRRAGRQRDWIDDVADFVFGPDAKPRRTARLARVTPSTALAPVAPAAIVTGAISPSRPADPPRLHQGDADAELVREAERAQARVDLVKLELARRAYDEASLGGQPVFATRPDWRVLERARDAWTDAELSASKAAGFEASAYINDADRKIVIAVAGTQDLRRDFLEADIWRALVQAQAPQQFFLAKSYIRSVIKRYQVQGYETECVGHSLGGAACAYVASELGIRAILVNPISAGKLPDQAKLWITNYVVDGDIANLVYGVRGNESPGDIQKVSAGSEAARVAVLAKFGPLAGPILIVRDLKSAVKVHQIDRALDLIAAHAGTDRVR